MTKYPGPFCVIDGTFNLFLERVWTFWSLPRVRRELLVWNSRYISMYTISYNKNISYIVTVTLKLPTPAVHESEEWAGRGGGVAQGHRGRDTVLVPGWGERGRGAGVFYTRNIKSHPIVSNVQFTKMRKFKSPSQCLTMDDWIVVMIWCDSW